MKGLEGDDTMASFPPLWHPFVITPWRWESKAARNQQSLEKGLHSTVFCLISCCVMSWEQKRFGGIHYSR